MSKNEQKMSKNEQKWQFMKKLYFKYKYIQPNLI